MTNKARAALDEAFRINAERQRKKMKEQVSVDDNLMTKEIMLCKDCYELKGQMCHTPECVFCRRTMKEVAYMLDALLIRPIVDGERLRL